MSHRLPMILAALAVAACRPSSTPAAADVRDTGISDTAWDAMTVRERCFAGLGDEAAGMPEYDAYAPTIGRHCAGTNHQDIQGVGKVVFVGDSITAGTPPTEEEDYYRVALSGMLEAQFGPLEIADCSEWGARTDDLLLEPHEQLQTCLPSVQDKPTLIVMTVGGNDMMSLLGDIAEGASAEAVQASVDRYVGLLDDAVAWIRESEAERFPAGVWVVLGNVYEFTDATGDVHACPIAEALGFPQPTAEQAVLLRSAYLSINEQYMALATRHRVDLIFLLEYFCGHGFHAGEPDNECFRGAEAETWFDGTCIHPNPMGHAQIAQMFLDVILE